MGAAKCSLVLLMLAIIAKASSLGIQPDNAGSQDTCSLKSGKKKLFEEKHVSLEENATENNAKDKCCERNRNPDPNVWSGINSVLFNDGFQYTFMPSKYAENTDRCAA